MVLLGTASGTLPAVLVVVVVVVVVAAAAASVMVVVVKVGVVLVDVLLWAVVQCVRWCCSMPDAGGG